VQLANGGFFFFWRDRGGGHDHSFPLCIGWWGCPVGKLSLHLDHAQIDGYLRRNDGLQQLAGSVVNSRRCFEYIEQVLWPREDLKRYEALRGISLHTVGISHYAICLLELHAREVIEIFLIF
jgi:hypothetical protein